MLPPPCLSVIPGLCLIATCNRSGCKASESDLTHLLQNVTEADDIIRELEFYARNTILCIISHHLTKTNFKRLEYNGNGKLDPDEENLIEGARKYSKFYDTSTQEYRETAKLDKFLEDSQCI